MKESCQVRVRCGCGGGEREGGLIENDMTGDNDTTRRKVIAPIPLMIRRIPKEDATSRTRCELVRCGGREVGIAGTPKNSKVIIGGRSAKESKGRCRSAHRLGRKAIEQVGGGVQGLSPEASRDRGIKQQGAHDVVGGTNHALSLAILSRGVRARHAKLDTVRKKEREVELSNSRPLSH